MDLSTVKKAVDDINKPEHIAASGSCHCRAVTFESSVPPVCLTSCFCKDCQKLHGAAFATFADFPTDKLVWKGKDRVEKKSEVAARTFCGQCYAPLSMVYNDEPENTGVVATLIDDTSLAKPLPEPEAHIFVKSKPTWYEIRDSARQNETWSAGWMEKHPWSR